MHIDNDNEWDDITTPVSIIDKSSIYSCDEKNHTVIIIDIMITYNHDFNADNNNLIWLL